MNSKIALQVILVSCENKEGLIDNSNHPELPECGVLGLLAQISPNIIFLSSGGTYQLIKRNGFNVIDFEEYTSAPQMKDGLVKSIDYKIHSSILAQDFNPEDLEFLKDNNLLKIDVVFTNFNPLNIDKLSKIDTLECLEKYRNKIDIGGPLMCMTSRKGFLNTLLLTDPRDYICLVNELNENYGKCSLSFRIKMLKKSSILLNQYNANISELFDRIDESLNIN
ncbi:MAG: hypothetical protein WCQ54_00855 [Clostridiaceae bacterium]